MLRIRVAIALLCTTVCGLAQSSIRDRVVLPATKNAASVTLLLPQKVTPDESAAAAAVSNDKGQFLSPQPAVKLDAAGANGASPAIKLEFSNLFFWGEARLPIRLSPTVSYTLVLQRGPAVSTVETNVGDDGKAAVWLYNHGPDPLNLKYRVFSGGQGACSIDAAGTPENCGALDKWYPATIQPAHSDAIRFAAPGTWFNPWSQGTTRDASLEMRFGDDPVAPEYRLDLKLQSATTKWSFHGLRLLSIALFHKLPEWLTNALGSLGSILWILAWVSLGAIGLMGTQIMVPNFRRVLQLEELVETYEERLRAVNSAVGQRLLTRCSRELMVLRSGLLMPEPEKVLSTFSLWVITDKLKLSGSTSTVNTLAALANRIEARLRLMEVLDERQTEAPGCYAAPLPPSLLWKRTADVRKVQSILAHQLINDADEKAARSILDGINDWQQARTVFLAALQSRIAAIRRQFPTSGDPAVLHPALEPYLASRFRRSAELMKQKEVTPPTEALTDDELADLDIDVYRVEVLADLIDLKPVLDRTEGLENQVLDALKSSDAAVLAQARSLLTMASQGITEQHIRQAIVDGAWDVFSEPVMVLEQEVLRVWLRFRDKHLNTAAARCGVECTWDLEITTRGAAPRTDKLHETGWDIQLLVARNQKMKLTPRFLLSNGDEVKPAGEIGTSKVVEITPRKALEAPAQARLLRASVDAMLTALVPVVTVAITQFQSSDATSLGIGKLMLLGFSSQAIRAAVIPESVTNAPPVPPAAPPPAGNQPTSGTTQH